MPHLTRLIRIPVLLVPLLLAACESSHEGSRADAARSSDPIECEIDAECNLPNLVGDCVAGACVAGPECPSDQIADEGECVPRCHDDADCVIESCASVCRAVPASVRMCTSGPPSCSGRTAVCLRARCELED